MARRAGLATRRAARQSYQKAAKSSPPGAGKRFAALKASAKAGGARSPGAVAAAIGRKKYGAKKMAQMAAAGRKRRR